MIINELNDYQLVNFLLKKEYMLQRTLAEKLNEKTGKTTKQSNFKELKVICDILGYDLIIQKRK